MFPAANLDPTSFLLRFCKFTRLRQPWGLVALFAALMFIEFLGLSILGTGLRGEGFAEFIGILHMLVALYCAWNAFRRAEHLAAVFWFLFVATLVILFVPSLIQLHDTLIDPDILSHSTWRLLYCIYGAPIVMMLFLSDAHRLPKGNSEIFLDLFQVGIVVALIYSTFFFLPVQHMSDAEALARDIHVSDTQSLILLIAVFVRLQFVRNPGTRNLLLRLGVFMLSCATVTSIGNWIDLNGYAAASVWFNLGWAIPQIVAGLIALTWNPEAKPDSAPVVVKFNSFLATNLVLVIMLSAMHLLLERWKAADGEFITDLAVSAFLLAFTLRLALTQYHQQQEILQRRAAQRQLTASNEKVGRLLDSARRQTAEITQISELGSLLQACASREEVFRLIPDRMRRLFPDTSGAISLVSASKVRLDAVALWGVTPVNQIFSPHDCWALRRGSVHVHRRGKSAERCSHQLGDGASICIPLVAIGEAVGLLSMEENDPAISVSEPDSDPQHAARRRHVATAVAEHIALAIANLSLRESLRLQAVRDPLTGLYNRRYMEEFLERELHSARRRHRPVSVMMLDLDHFKRYNDKLGHAAGDRALAAVGQALQRSVRAEDVACRYGGEEFTLILPECPLSQAAKRAEQIRRRVAEVSAELSQLPTDALTVSIGVAAFDETTDRVDLVLKFADEALYEAKRSGRNRVVAARPASALPPENFTANENLTAEENSTGTENLTGKENCAEKENFTGGRRSNDPLTITASTSD